MSITFTDWERIKLNYPQENAETILMGGEVYE